MNRLYLGCTEVCGEEEGEVVVGRRKKGGGLERAEGKRSAGLAIP